MGVETSRLDPLIGNISLFIEERIVTLFDIIATDRREERKQQLIFLTMLLREVTDECPRLKPGPRFKRVAHHIPLTGNWRELKEVTDEYHLQSPKRIFTLANGATNDINHIKEFAVEHRNFVNDEYLGFFDPLHHCFA